jgi:hypothetical protein
VAVKRVLHFVGACLECLKQISMTAQKILQHIGQLGFGRLRMQRKDAADNMIGARLICRIEITWLSRGFEWPHDDARCVWPQI